MEITLLDNRSRSLLGDILPAIAQSQECRIAVAYVSQTGLHLLQPALHECLERGALVEFLVGLDAEVTEPDALWDLYHLSRARPEVAVYCLADLDRGARFHPKLYFLKAGSRATIVIGSSNLTEGGLERNPEINARVVADASEEIVSEVHSAYNALKFHPQRVVPDEEFLHLYGSLHAVRRRETQAARRAAELRSLTVRLREKASSLQRPAPSMRDLSGWQRLVFDHLPTGEFHTRDLYQFEDEFSLQYPENRNVRAKVRQVLQQLRDIGVIRHLRRETWMKE